MPYIARMTRKLVAGIFIGGVSSRMNGGPGGPPKGMLAAPDGRSIVARCRDLLVEVGAVPLLIGRRDGYASVGLEVVPDAHEDAGAGPLAGLCALLARAGDDAHALAIACDMPFVTRALLERLAFAPPAVAVAPRDDEGRWQPFFARYDVARARPVVESRLAAIVGQSADAPPRSLQSLLDALGAVPLDADAADSEALADWDTPEDLEGTPCASPRRA